MTNGLDKRAQREQLAQGYIWAEQGTHIGAEDYRAQNRRLMEAYLAHFDEVELIAFVNRAEGAARRARGIGLSNEERQRVVELWLEEQDSV